MFHKEQNIERKIMCYEVNKAMYLLCIHNSFVYQFILRHKLFSMLFDNLIIFNQKLDLPSSYV